MYEPVGRPRRLTRRGVYVGLFMTVALLVGIVVTVVRTMPHPQQEDQLTLDQLGMMIIPDAAQTALVATMVKTRLGNPAPGASPAPPCVAPGAPHTWDSTQRKNATTIVQVGVVLEVPARAEVVALATAM